MAKDVPALLGYSSLLSSCGKERESLQLLASAQGLGGLPDGHPASCMVAAAALAPVKLRVELGDLAGARQGLEEHVKQDNGQQQDNTVSAGRRGAGDCDVAAMARQSCGLTCMGVSGLRSLRQWRSPSLFEWNVKQSAPVQKVLPCIYYA